MNTVIHTPIQDSPDMRQFDVMVLYIDSGTISRKNQRKIFFPFPTTNERHRYNRTYAFLLNECQKKGLSAAFTSSDKIIGPGEFQGYWTYDGVQWVWNKGKAKTRVIFDKFTPRSDDDRNKYQLMISDSRIKTFKSPHLLQLFRDKWKTYQKFTSVAIPTVPITHKTKSAIIEKQLELDQLVQQHSSKSDFSKQYIVKDQFGAGGDRVYKVDTQDPHWYEELRKRWDEKEDYVLQPFISCYEGKQFNLYSGYIDIRVILLNKKIIQSYIRIAKPGEFRANAMQGGQVVYLDIQDLPQDLLERVYAIVDLLPKDHQLYTLDFLRGRGGRLYFIEGNDSPGITWYNKSDEIHTKRMISLIVDQLGILVQDADKES